jgi:hypothetical protein
MPENAISITLSSNETIQSCNLIQAFQSIYKLENENEVKEQLSNSFGESFVEILYSELSTQDHILKYKKYLKKSLIENIGSYISFLQKTSKNTQRLWQEFYGDSVSPKEISPDQITLITRSRTGKRYMDEIELYYDSSDSYALKAAVFATAFESAGFYIDSISTVDEYEED